MTGVYLALALGSAAAAGVHSDIQTPQIQRHVIKTRIGFNFTGLINHRRDLTAVGIMPRLTVKTRILMDSFHHICLQTYIVTGGRHEKNTDKDHRTHTCGSPALHSQYRLCGAVLLDKGDIQEADAESTAHGTGYVKTYAGDITPEGGRPVIVIDAGHGGIDAGTSARDGTAEKDINLAIALKLKEIAENIR